MRDEEWAPERRMLGFWRVAALLVVMASVGLLLGAQPLRLHANGLEPSPFRTAALAITGPLATAGDFLYLDRPWEWATGNGGSERADAESGPPESFEPPGAGATSTTLVPTATTTTLPGGPGDPPTTTTQRVTSSTTTTTEPVFTAREPLRILVVGDSLAVMMGYGLMRLAEANPALDVEMVTKVSSGLSRPDFYDWPREITHTVARYRPHVTVIHFGGNDKQPIRAEEKSLEPFSLGWKEEYYLRIWAFLDIIFDSGGEVVWMGLPIMRSEKFSETCRELNSMYRAVCEHRRGATYVDGYGLFQDEQGMYNAYLVDSSGKRQLMRQSDGIHFSRVGGYRQAEAVMQVLGESYRLEP